MDDNVLALPIHKLLLQPFVENAILHGFEGVKRSHELFGKHRKTDRPSLHPHSGQRQRNVTRSNVSCCCRDIPKQTSITLVCAMLWNACICIYGSAAKVRIESVPDEGTTIVLLLPLLEEEKS